MLGTRLLLLIFALAVNALAETQVGNAENPRLYGQSKPENRSNLQRIAQPIHRIPMPLPKPLMVRPVSPGASLSPTAPTTPTQSTYIPRQPAKPLRFRPYPQAGFVPASSEAPIITSTAKLYEPEIASALPKIAPPAPEISTFAPELVTTEKVLDISQTPPLHNKPVFNVPRRPRPNWIPRPIPPPSSTVSRLPIPETTIAPTTESVVITETEPITRPYPQAGFVPANSEAPIITSTAKLYEPEIASALPKIAPPAPEISTFATEIVTTEKVLDISQTPPPHNKPVFNVPRRPRPNWIPRPIPPPSSTVSRLPIPETTIAPTTESVVITEKEPELPAESTEPELPPVQELPNPELWPEIEPEDVVVEPASELPSSELPPIVEPEPEITTTLAPEPVPTPTRNLNRHYPSRPYPIQPKPRPSKPKWNNKPNHPKPSLPHAARPDVAPVAPKPKPSVTPSNVQMKDPMQFNFECTMLNGYFSLPNECDSYIECKKNVAYKYECPDGLHFNPNIMWPEYPCAFPSEVKCEGKNNQLPQPTSECPRRYGFFPMNDGSCGQYIMCQEGRATIMNCPPGLAFNPAESSCDWPINVPACNPNAFQGFTCPAPPMDGDKPSDLIFKYRYGSSCKEYIACQLGHPRLLSCDYGLSFDEYSDACIDSEYVENCKNTY